MFYFYWCNTALFDTWLWNWIYTRRFLYVWAIIQQLAKKNRFKCWHISVRIQGCAKIACFHTGLTEIIWAFYLHILFSVSGSEGLRNGTQNQFKQSVQTSNLLKFVKLKSYPNRIGEHFFHVACNWNWTSGLKNKKNPYIWNPLRLKIRK